MTTLTIQVPKARHVRLRRLARERGVSVNRLLEDFSASGLAQSDAELRFRALGVKGSPAKALKLLDRLDEAYSRGK